MGCDIHCHAERSGAIAGLSRWTHVPDFSPFDWRNYGIYGFLAGIRNYSAISPIAAPRGLPYNISRETSDDYQSWGEDAHSTSWLSVEELTSYDYDQIVEDLRVMRNNDGGCTADPGQGVKLLLREFLGTAFFVELARLKEVKAQRIVFWFDN